MGSGQTTATNEQVSRWWKKIKHKEKGCWKPSSRKVSSSEWVKSALVSEWGYVWSGVSKCSWLVNFQKDKLFSKESKFSFYRFLFHHHRCLSWNQLHRFQRKRIRSRNFASLGQITRLQCNREIFRNLQIHEIFPDEHRAWKKCLGIPPQLSRVSQRGTLGKESCEATALAHGKHWGRRGQEIRNIDPNC